MGIPDHLTCLLRNLCAGKKQQVEPDVEQQTGSKSGKEYVKVGPITSWQIDVETMKRLKDLFYWDPKWLLMVTKAMKLKDACSLEEKLWQT